MSSDVQNSSSDSEHDGEDATDGVPAVDVERFAIADIRQYARTIAHGDTVVIFDTTLRDGEQSPGATLNIQEKMEIAHQLARLGVDVMEAGFPAASPGDLEAVKRIATTVGCQPRRGKEGEVKAPPIIAGLARANKNDIDKAARQRTDRGLGPGSHPQSHGRVHLPAGGRLEYHHHVQNALTMRGPVYRQQKKRAS